MRQKYKNDFLQAGAYAGQVRSFGKSLIKKGASYNDCLRKINQKIKELGGKPAFPPQIALNEVAAHFLPGPTEDIIFDNQLVKVDVGVCFNGAIGDCAVTIDLSGKYQHIIDAAEAALLAAEKSIKVGMYVRDLGKIIEETIMGYGLQPVRNLSGHGLGFNKIHTPPQIPNYHDNSVARLQPGMTFAVEPFATNGKGMIEELGASRIYSYAGRGKVTSEEAKLLLKKIESFEGLPFSLHDLLNEGIPLKKVEEAVAELQSAKIIHGYPPLVEVAKGFVAQAENSILIDEKGSVFVTTRI